jgi:hypothetical protein
MFERGRTIPEWDIQVLKQALRFSMVDFPRSSDYSKS